MGALRVSALIDVPGAGIALQKSTLSTHGSCVTNLHTNFVQSYYIDYLILIEMDFGKM